MIPECKQFRALATRQLIGLTIVLSGCESNWPGFHDEIKQEFEVLEPLFLAVEVEMENDRLVYLPSTFDMTRERLSAEPRQPPLTDDQRLKYASILDGRTAFHIENLGDDTFAYSTSYITDKTHFVVYLVHRDKRPELRHCDVAQSAEICGWCQDSLADQWTVNYQWISKGIESRSEDDIQICHELQRDSFLEPMTVR